MYYLKIFQPNSELKKQRKEKKRKIHGYTNPDRNAPRNVAAVTGILSEN